MPAQTQRQRYYGVCLSGDALGFHGGREWPGRPGSVTMMLDRTSCILMIPAAAMLFKVEGWAWDVADFVIIWVIVAGAVAAYQFVASKAAHRAYRVAAGIAVTTGLILMWINGAVGPDVCRIGAPVSARRNQLRRSGCANAGLRRHAHIEHLCLGDATGQ